MLRTLTAGNCGHPPWLLSGCAFESPIGLRMLLPGMQQCRWGQRQRGLAFFGSFASAFLVGIWAWGSPLSWGCLGLAYVTHTISMTDALRQASFPVYRAKRATLLVFAALALLLYVPVFAGLMAVAWPGFEPANNSLGFLVNRFAYRAAAPSQGQWIWMHPLKSGEPMAAQILAISGQEVEWTGQSWKVDGAPLTLQSVGRLSSWPQACRFKVPPDTILVEPHDDGGSTLPVGPIVLVSPDRIIGRAWAQYYPVRDRRLL